MRIKWIAEIQGLDFFCYFFSAMEKKLEKYFLMKTFPDLG